MHSLDRRCCRRDDNLERPSGAMATATPESATRVARLLAGVPWFAALPFELRRQVLATTVEREASAGEYIAHAGEPCRHWFGVVHGVLQMYVASSDGSETTLCCVGQGQWCGDGSLLKKELRRYDLKSLTASRVLMVPAQTFETLRDRSIAFNRSLCEIMNERMGVFVGMLEASRLQRPELRVARGLLMLTDESGEDAQSLSIAQHELALICGLSRQRVNAALSNLRHDGLVQHERHRGDFRVAVTQLRAFLLESA